MTDSMQGYIVGQAVWFIGQGQSFDNGDSLVAGSGGDVSGPASSEFPGLSVKFPHNRGGVDIPFVMISDTDPMPDHAIGQTVWYIGKTESFDNGDSLIPGSSGAVAGPANGEFAGLSVKFPHNKGGVNIPFVMISGTDPMPGYAVGQTVWYCGKTESFDNGDSLVPGSSGEVAGPANGEFPGLSVKFPHNKGGVNIPRGMISEHAVGQTVWYIGMAESFDNGDSLVPGSSGEVAGPADGEFPGLSVKFPQNKEGVNILCSMISGKDPMPDHSIGQTVWYTGKAESFDNGDSLVPLSSGEVAGPPSGEFPGLSVRFPNCKGAINIPFGMISDTDPSEVSAQK